jgi:hypothetical protein
MVGKWRLRWLPCWCCQNALQNVLPNEQILWWGGNDHWIWLENTADMLWWCCCGCCCYNATAAVATPAIAGRQAWPRCVFSRANAATFLSDSTNGTLKCTECCNHICSECLVALLQPIGANAVLIDDYYGFYTCCLCCSA